MNVLLEIFGFQLSNENKPIKTKSKRTKTVKCLSELAGEALKKVPKMVLNAFGQKSVNDGTKNQQ